jgi:hypothetical protein
MHAERRHIDPTLLPIHEVISSMQGSGDAPSETFFPENTTFPVQGGKCHEVATDQELSLISIELESAARAASGFSTPNETVKYQGEVWRSELWRDLVERVLHIYGSDSEVIRPDPLLPQVLFDWGDLRVRLSTHGDTTLMQTWDRQYTDEAGAEGVENYLSMLHTTEELRYSGGLQTFAEAHQIRALRLRSRSPLLTIPAVLHILEQTTAQNPVAEITQLTLCDGEVRVLDPGVLQTREGYVFAISEDGSIDPIDTEA